MVGTAPASVGFSAAIIAASGAACRNRSGMISEAPHMNAAYGRPHAIAWNIGTIAQLARGRAEAERLRQQTCIECR